MPSSDECIGVILAGGASRRMGTDKANLLWQGLPMHAHLRALLGAVGAEQIVLSGRAEFEDGLADQRPGMGPLSALASVFAAQAHNGVWLLILAIDMPRLSAETLRMLCPNCDEDYRCFDQQVLPLGVRLSEKTRRALGDCAQDANSSQRSIRQWLSRLTGTRFEITPALRWQLQSANTPEQWQALQ